MKVLVVYGTTHGHTRTIAEHIATRLRSHGAEAVVADARRATPIGFDAVIVGGRVHGNRYPWRVTRFIRTNLDALNARPSAFFSVSLLQLADDPAKRVETSTLPMRLIPALGWTPDRMEVIAGALMWTRFGIFRPLMRAIWRTSMKAAVVDTHRDQIFTDWNQVDAFADSFLRFAMLCLTPEMPREIAHRLQEEISP